MHVNTNSTINNNIRCKLKEKKKNNDTQTSEIIIHS